MRSWLLLSILLSAAPLVAGCLGGDGHDSCLVGESFACTCTSGAVGAQVCLSGGEQLGPCLCSLAAADGTSLDDAGSDAGGHGAGPDVPGDGLDVEIPDGAPGELDSGPLATEVAPDVPHEEAVVDAEVVEDGGAQDGLTSPDATPTPAGIRIELTWRTPGDPDELDEGGDQIYTSAGSDVDLHFLHPKAYGAYFDWTYDCYWDNIEPEWGIFSPSDNPRLERDDSDGAGPELLTLAVPEPTARYKVGVHYWNDWGYGNSFATVRVYVDGLLVHTSPEVELTQDDMWDALTIENGHITPLDTITPSYRER